MSSRQEPEIIVVQSNELSNALSMYHTITTRLHQELLRMDISDALLEGNTVKLGFQNETQRDQGITVIYCILTKAVGLHVGVASSCKDLYSLVHSLFINPTEDTVPHVNLIGFNIDPKTDPSVYANEYDPTLYDPNKVLSIVGFNDIFGSNAKDLSYVSVIRTSMKSSVPEVNKTTEE